MDHRSLLPYHTLLDFEGMPCYIEESIGQGSNAIVYRGWYPDRLDPGSRHHVLIKELFPLHPRQKIRRTDGLRIEVDPEAEEFWQTHRDSFLAGNEVHLRLLADHPDLLGANLNSFSRNGTLYSVLGCSGGRSLLTELNAAPQNLRQIVRRMLCILQALEAFHKSGYLHLDISPDNIMLVGTGDTERAFLIDYNSACAMDALDNLHLSLKPGYTAPEVETGMRGAIGFSSDLYAVTAVFFRCLMGRTLSLEEMLRSTAPAGSGSLYLSDMPQTVCYMVEKILKKGLHTLPARRYSSIGPMMQAFRELLDRIDNVGVTHWALWENGRRSVDDLIRQNPALRYLKDPGALYPIRLQLEDGSCSLDAFLQGMLGPQGQSCLIRSGGGMGKTTMLLHTALTRLKRYSPSAPAVFYISLGDWNGNGAHYIHTQILSRLRFKPEENNYSSALHALDQLLSQPLKSRDGDIPTALLLLDGLNEIHTDPEPLLREIRQLSAMAGVRILATSRNPADDLPLKQAQIIPLNTEDVEDALGSHGLLIPQNPNVMELLRTPLILSLYIQTGSGGKQPDIQDAAGLQNAYLRSLLEKEQNRFPENAPERWQIDAALNWILPRIAAEAQRTGNSLSQLQLLKLMTGCFRQLRSGKLRSVFPQWIGHSRDILGNAPDPEMWLGLMIHDLLWQRMGLLIREPSGSFRVFHQAFAEHLIPLDRHCRQSIRKRQVTRWGIALAGILCTLALAIQSNPLIGDYVMVARQKWGDSGSFSQNIFEQLRQEAYDYWEECLGVNDRIFGNLTWALEQVDAYAQEGSWETLLKARAACTAALQDLQNIQVPEYPLTMWDQLLLTLSRVDTVWLEYNDAENNLSSTRDTLSYFTTLLENEVYMKSTVAAFPELVRNYRQIAETNIRYQASATNYILLQLDRPELWNAMPRQFPTIAQACGEWSGDEKALQATAEAVLDEMESGINGTEAFTAASEYTLQILQDAAQTGDLAPVQEELSIPRGIPDCFPTPYWLPPSAGYYLRTDGATGEKVLIRSREVPMPLPEVCYISCGAVRLEDVKTYPQQLAYFGIACHAGWDNDTQTYQILAAGANSSLLIEWTEAETILYLTEPVGCLMPELYLAAMQTAIS